MPSIEEFLKNPPPIEDGKRSVRLGGGGKLSLRMKELGEIAQGLYDEYTNKNSGDCLCSSGVAKSSCASDREICLCWLKHDIADLAILLEDKGE